MPLIFWVVLTLAVLLVILFFGLKPKGYHFSNDVNWLSNQPGIRFNGYGIAYTEPIKEFGTADEMNTNGFSIEITLKPASYHEKGFNFLFVIHNGDDRKQLVIGQYLSSLIVMNGDDYDHSRKTKRISAKLTETEPIPQFVTITTGKDGTRIYLNGRRIRTQRNLTLKIPEGENARLLLGNSVYGKNNWNGDVLGLAVYGYPLSVQEAAEHFKHWFKEGNFLFAKKDKPDLLYMFDEKKGEKVMDRSGGHIDLHIPSKMKVLNKRILSFSWNRLKFNAEFFEDVMINLIGFIPLGFFLSATFAKAGDLLERHAVLITVAFCFFVSLFIEVLQAWIPSRSSDVLDLVLNTVGGLLGASLTGLKERGPRLNSLRSFSSKNLTGQEEDRG
jgi:VanZ like protein/concanavalin A-like lectin/glucanase superfamily protein